MKIVVCLSILLGSMGALWAQTPRQYPLGIEEMFELADRQSRSIRTFGLAEEAAAEAVRVTKNARLPEVNASLSASYLGDGWMSDRDFTDGFNAPMPHFGNNFAVEATQVLYAGGSISAQVALAQLQQQMAVLDQERNRQDIRLLLAGNYLELYKLSNQSRVYASNIEQTRRLLSDIKARLQEGLALKNDVTRYELQLKSLELALTQIENSREILNHQLVTVLNLPPETVIAVDTTLLSRLPQVAPEGQWQQRAADTSPLLRQAALGIEQSRQGEQLARADRLPSVALFAGDHFDGPVIIEVPPINKNFNYWYAGVGLKYNIASLYKSKKNIRLARINTQKAGESELLAREQVQTEVKATYVRFAEAFNTYETQVKSLELATENYAVVHNRYLNDLALITDMLDASNAKLSAELQVANAQINILFNYYKLKKAAGNL